MGKKQRAPVSKFRPFNRMEISIAEIMRINYPLGISSEDGALWMDIVDDLTKLFMTKDERFDSDEFYNRCFGEDEEERLRMAYEAQAEKEAEVMAQLAWGPLDAPVD